MRSGRSPSDLGAIYTNFTDDEDEDMTADTGITATNTSLPPMLRLPDYRTAPRDSIAGSALVFETRLPAPTPPAAETAAETAAPADAANVTGASAAPLTVSNVYSSPAGPRRHRQRMRSISVTVRDPSNTLVNASGLRADWYSLQEAASKGRGVFLPPGSNRTGQNGVSVCHEAVASYVRWLRARPEYDALYRAGLAAASAPASKNTES